MVRTKAEGMGDALGPVPDTVDARCIIASYEGGFCHLPSAGQG